MQGDGLDAAVGPIKQWDRGLGAGDLLTGIAAAPLAGEDFLAGLVRQRRRDRSADHVGAGAGVHDRGRPGPKFTPEPCETVGGAVAAERDDFIDTRAQQSRNVLPMSPVAPGPCNSHALTAG